MSRLLGEHFKRDGLPKRRYLTQAEAQKARGKAHDKVYRCKFCGGWHRATRRTAPRKE